ncbi:hypothetical protein AJ80_09730 [Polytolypa hystricis UAMH7299]|uniref:DH domain-containing protein n=1 Tax=Polytolypa hystricis (strain UAMH7299) TaxID=1447883 RepID=A0A2B7WKK8_POLH7|nr:hypothetical protein AJ80_09730 [Polytolypa hystricis UAMH7299]
MGSQADGEEENVKAEDTSQNEPGIPAGPASQDNYGFKQWIRSIRKHKAVNYEGPQRFVLGWPENEALDESYRMLSRVRDDATDKSSVASSSYLRTVKTASISMTNLSMFTRPRTNTQTSTQRSVCHSSRFSGSDARRSMDSNKLGSTLSLDEGAWNRAVHRRQVIRELMDTEATYVAGLKALGDVLSTFVITRTSLQRNTFELLKIHEKILAELRNAMPHSVGIGARWTVSARRSLRGNLDTRFQNADRRSVTSRTVREPIESRIKCSRSVAAEPTEAAEAALILQRKLSTFTAYEDYGVKYQLITNEVELLRKSISSWHNFDRGIEALLKSVTPFNTRGATANYGLTLGDLLMKARDISMCKYQLFLADLLKCTPVADCPTSHAIIDRTLGRVLDVSQNINRAIGDPHAKDRIQKTILLQEKLMFPRQGGERDLLRDFGPIKVCGVLHVAYQTIDSVSGRYVMCALFSAYLLLAIPSEEHRKFTVLAILRTSDLKLEGVDNGTGIQCGNVPFSWKIIVESRRQQFELIMSACSEKESTQWKDHILKQLSIDASQSSEDRGISSDTSVVYLGLKSLSAVADRQTHGLSRRLSVHSTLTTTTSNTECIRLFVKGTLAATSDHNTHGPPLSRSLSVPSSRLTTILAPKRQDRIRMERWLNSVWTSDVIPYPGMPTGRGEYLIRSSAESFMRRLSGRRPFAKRSTSLTTTITTKSLDHLSTFKEDRMWDAKDKAEDFLHGASPPGYEGKEEGEDKFVIPPSPPARPKSQPVEGVKGRKGNKETSGARRCSMYHKPPVRKKWSVSLFKTTSPPKARYSLPIGS